MPVDILLRLENGDSLLYHIPIDYFYPKSIDRKYLPIWHFSEKSYNATIDVPDKVDEIVIDPGGSLLDINRLNNSSNFIPKIDFYFLKNQRYAPPTDAYLWETWPGFFYNDVDKFKIGLANYAAYLNRYHTLILKGWYKTKTNDVDFHLDYRHPLQMFNRSAFSTNIYRLDGLSGANARVLFRPSDDLDFILNVDHYKMFDDRYFYYPWEEGVVNTVNFNVNYEIIGQQSESFFKLSLKNAIAGSEHDFSIARLDARQTFFSQYSDYILELNFSGGAAETNTPVQEKFNLAGANGSAEFGYAYYRAKGTLPVDWRRDGHLYKPEFAGVRGVSLIPDSYFNNNIWAASFNFFSLISFPIWIYHCWIFLIMLCSLMREQSGPVRFRILKRLLNLREYLSLYKVSISYTMYLD